MTENFGITLLYATVSVVLLAVLMQLARLLRPKEMRPETDRGRQLKYKTYECGIEIDGPSWIQFNIRFYVVALIFIIFDVEVLLLFPWAAVFTDIGMIAFVEMIIFLGILAVGLAYAWRKGDLEWVKQRVKNAGKRYQNAKMEL